MDYAQKVIETLRREFTDLNDPVIAEAIGKAVARHYARHNPAFEALLDVQGNWRLKPAGRDTGRVQVACYRFTETPADRQRTDRLNAALNKIR